MSISKNEYYTRFHSNTRFENEYILGFKYFDPCDEVWSTFTITSQLRRSWRIFSADCSASSRQLSGTTCPIEFLLETKLILFRQRVRKFASCDCFPDVKKIFMNFCSIVTIFQTSDEIVNLSVKHLWMKFYITCSKQEIKILLNY